MKAQVQDFRNWVRSDPESTTRSAPDSRIIGLIESSEAIASQEAGTSGTPKESAPDTGKTSPFGATRGSDTIAFTRSGGGEAGGSGESTVRVVPFKSLPESVLTFLSAITRNGGVPSNGARNAVLVCLNIYRKIGKCTDIPL